MSEKEDELSQRFVELANGLDDDEKRATEDKHNATVRWGFVTAVLLAPVGIFFGIRLLLQDRIGPGIAVILVALLSLAASIAYVASEDSGSSSSTSDDGPCIITLSGSQLCGLAASNWCLEFDPTNESSGCRTATSRP